MTTSTRILILAFLLMAGPSCGNTSAAEGPNSETHWLRTCASNGDCDGAGSCICGQCTTPCSDNCTWGPPGTTCTRAPTCATTAGGACLLPCSANDGCSGSAACSSGVCVSSIEAVEGTTITDAAEPGQSEGETGAALLPEGGDGDGTSVLVAVPGVGDVCEAPLNAVAVFATHCAQTATATVLESTRCSGWRNVSIGVCDQKPVVALEDGVDKELCVFNGSGFGAPGLIGAVVQKQTQEFCSAASSTFLGGDVPSQCSWDKATEMEWSGAVCTGSADAGAGVEAGIADAAADGAGRSDASTCTASLETVAGDWSPGCAGSYRDALPTPAAGGACPEGYEAVYTASCEGLPIVFYDSVGTRRFCLYDGTDTGSLVGAAALDLAGSYCDGTSKSVAGGTVPASCRLDVPVPAVSSFATYCVAGTVTSSDAGADP